MSRLSIPAVLATLAATVGVGAAPAAAASSGHPARGSASLRLPSIYVVHQDAVTVVNRPVRVEGTVRPYVAGQWVNFTASVGSKRIRATKLRIRPNPGGRTGRFSISIASPRAGIVVVKAGHHRTSAMGGFLAQRRFAALYPQAGSGSTGRFVQLIQQRLADLHFYIPQTGVYDSGTALAIDAYHRLLGWGTTGALDGRTVSYLLNGWGQFKIRFPHQGRHAEGNLTQQLLALADGPNVQLIFPISSGKPSTPTVLGSYRVYRRVPGYLPDGMYFSSFFTGGYAIHGYNPAPDYPASHGCMRLPIPDAITAYSWLNFGDWVDVYH